MRSGRSRIEFFDSLFEFLLGAEYNVVFIKARRVDLRRAVSPHPEDVVDMVDAALRPVHEHDTPFDGRERLYRTEEAACRPGIFTALVVFIRYPPSVESGPGLAARGRSDHPNLVSAYYLYICEALQGAEKGREKDICRKESGLLTRRPGFLLSG